MVIAKFSHDLSFSYAATVRSTLTEIQAIRLEAIAIRSKDATRGSWPYY